MSIVADKKRGGWKLGEKIQYPACTKCGTPKTTIKQRYSPLCAQCAYNSFKRVVVDGKQQCTQCGDWKTLGQFYKQKNLTLGIRPECKSCADKRVADAHAAKHEKRLQYSRTSYYRNIEKNKVTAKLYRETHKEEIAKKNKAKRESLKDYYKAKGHEWYLKNKDKVMTKLRKRLAIMKGSGGVFTEKDWQEVLARYGRACLNCGSTENIVRDHVMPVIKGGRNDKYNIQPLCGHCNNVKHAKHIDFRFDKGQWND